MKLLLFQTSFVPPLTQRCAAWGSLVGKKAVALGWPPSEKTGPRKASPEEGKKGLKKGALRVRASSAVGALLPYLST